MGVTQLLWYLFSTSMTILSPWQGKKSIMQRLWEQGIKWWNHMLPQGSKPRPSLFISASWCSCKYGTEGGKDWQGYRWIYLSSMERLQRLGGLLAVRSCGVGPQRLQQDASVPPCYVSRQNQMIQNGDDGKWQYLWPWTGGVWSYLGFQVPYLCATVLCKYSLSATCQLIVERPPSTSATASFHNVAAIHLSIRRADIDHQKSMAIYISPYSEAAVQVSNSRPRCLESDF
jgi:hypothetical protein